MEAPNLDQVRELTSEVQKDTTTILSDTVRVYKIGKSQCMIPVKKLFVEALDIQGGDIVEITIRQTGMKGTPRPKRVNK